MKRLLPLVLLLSFLASAQQRPLPVTGSWINLFYQDVRNKYTNPENMDNTSPELWKAKVNQMHRMGIEYIVFMAVANDGLADYPSKIMPHAYPLGKQSPVCAIMEQAEECGLSATVRSYDGGNASLERNFVFICKRLKAVNFNLL